MVPVTDILSILQRLIGWIVGQINQGVSNDEILARLQEPESVGRELIDAIRARRDRFADYVKNG